MQQLFLFKNLGLRNKILLLVLVSTTLVISLTIFYFSINVRKNTATEAKRLADSETEKYAGQIKEVFNKALECTNSLSKVFIENKKLGNALRDSINKEILFRVLISEKDYLCLWLVYELKALDPTYNKEHGRLRNIAINLKDRLSFTQIISDTLGNIPDNDYYQVKRNNKQIVCEPYIDIDSTEMKGILMVSPITPLLNDNKFEGVIGIDLSLVKVQQLVQEINPFESSVSYLVSPNHVIVSHTKKEMYNKNLMEVNMLYKKEFERALKEIDQNLTSHFEIYRQETRENVYVSFAPIIR